MSASDAQWHENAVIYAIDVERFQDSDGDGVGDLQGLIDRLDYLDHLDVDCVWLLPFYPTPNRDNGYDVMDYYGVDPRHGDLGDFVEFVHAARERDIHVLVDLVVNHTSEQHPWFQAAREDPDSKYRDYYVWSSDPPISDDPRRSAFPGEGEHDRVWTYDSEAGAYYYHRFYSFQPDLDLSNPDVRAEIRKIVEYWLELGVSGFRIDAAGLMTQQKRPGLPPLEDRHDFLRELRSYTTDYDEDVVLLGEADDDPAELSAYFGDGAEFDLLMNFVLDAYLWLAFATERGRPIVKCFERLPAVPEGGAWANFLRNYDELNVGRLPEAEQRSVFDRFAPDEDARIYGRGIRRRLAPMFDGDRRRIELAFSLLFSMPGASLFVFGDEIGMGEDLSAPGREAARAVMQWSAAENAGFSTAPQGAVARPIIDDGPFAYERVNVEAQRGDDGSLLEFVRRLIGVFHELPPFHWNDLIVHDSDAEGAFVHRFDCADATIGMAHNLAPDACSVDLDGDVGGRAVRELFGPGSVRTPGSRRHEIDLDGYGYSWFRLERS